MVSAINNGGGFYRMEIYLHEARMAGAIIHNPCVNKSTYHTTVYNKDLYIGLMHIEKVESDLILKIIEEREQYGNYQSLEDFVNRITIAIESLQRLIFIGAFRFTGKTKNELALSARLLLVNFKSQNKNLTLLQEPVVEYKLPKLNRSFFEDAFDEIEILSFPVSYSPFDLLKTTYRGDVLVKDLLNHHQQYVKMLAYLVSIKKNPTKQGMMAFGTWIDVEGNFFDTAHFAKNLETYPLLLADAPDCPPLCAKYIFPDESLEKPYPEVGFPSVLERSLECTVFPFESFFIIKPY
jgi:DNA polymerase-3 subunit alpha/error-prone DNA polymerase